MHPNMVKSKDHPQIVQCVRRQVVDLQTVHAVVEARMFCNLDMFCLKIKPDNIVSGVCNKSKDNAFAW